MKLVKVQLLILLVILLAASPAFASFSSTYDVSIDTNGLGLNGTSGYLYMQYDPLMAVASTATVSAFTVKGGSLGVQDTVDVVNGSAVSGTLPGSVIFSNSNAVNDYNQAITLGSSLNFLLTLNSNAIPGNPAGGVSIFSVSMFADALGSNPLVNVNGVNNSVAGDAIDINLNNNGATSVTSYVAQANAVPTPIPAAAYLFGSGLLGLIGIRKKMPEQRLSA